MEKPKIDKYTFILVSNMDSILAALEVNVEKLYKEKKFHEVEEMFSTFLKESQNEPAPIKARALNNRGHAKYMQVEFDAALQDYNEGTYTYSRK